MFPGVQLGPTADFWFDKDLVQSGVPSNKADLVAKLRTKELEKINGKRTMVGEIVIVVSGVVPTQAASSGVAASDDEIRSYLIQYVKLQLAGNFGVVFDSDVYRGAIIENVINVVDAGYQFPRKRLAQVTSTGGDKAARTYRIILSFVNPKAPDPTRKCPSLAQLRNATLTVRLAGAGDALNADGTVTLKAATSVTVRAYARCFIPHRGSWQMPAYHGWQRQEISSASANVVIDRFATGNQKNVKPKRTVSFIGWLMDKFNFIPDGMTGFTAEKLASLEIPFRGISRTDYPEDYLDSFLAGLPPEGRVLGSIGANAMEDTYGWPYAQGYGPTDGVVLTDDLLMIPIVASAADADPSRFQGFSGAVGEEPTWKATYSSGAPTGHVVVWEEHGQWEPDYVRAVAEYCGLDATERGKLRQVAMRGRGQGKPDTFALEDERGAGYPIRLVG